ncbi:MAG TPA: hypothetical protein VGL93_14545 [Streptosporangiaceae bacterium]
MVVAPQVQRVRIFQERQCQLDELARIGEVSGGVGKSPLQLLALPLDLAQLGLDLGLGELAVRGQVEQVLLAGVQRFQLSCDLLL